ncbi:MAG TPA: YtxH domain-containing protein [Anaerolineae bacterium]
MSDNNSDLGAFLAGFVIGGLVGAATALILAPQSGEETRAQIANRSEELRRASEERVHQYRELADRYTHEYRDRAEELITDTRERVQEAGGRVQEQARIVLDAGKERVTQVKDQVSNTIPQEDETDDASTVSD